MHQHVHQRVINFIYCLVLCRGSIENISTVFLLTAAGDITGENGVNMAKNIIACWKMQTTTANHSVNLKGAAESEDNSL